MGDKQGAIDDYSQAITLDPDYLYAYNNRGVVREEIGDYRGATEDYNKASKLNLNGKYTMTTEYEDEENTLYYFKKVE
jgi:tetratricopeptide (TPR) repeat protein